MTRPGMQRLSVVIPNYNYERFVAAAIESALALDWPDVEVVVVDDGSTDSSLEVIRRYEDRATVLSGDNGTQRVAVNRGLAASTGDVVIILDSDDVLPSGLPRHLAAAWGPEVSKAQFRMQRIDVVGSPLGKPFPTLPSGASPELLRSWHVRTTAYPTPPGSGNAYARWFVDLVAPIGPETGNFADSALLALAPLLGDVVWVPEVVVGYRQHGANDSNLLRDPTRFGREVDRARARWELARRTAPTSKLRESALFRSRELLQLRVAAQVATPDQPPAIPGDGPARMFGDALRSPIDPGPESARARVLVMIWCLLALLAPPPVTRRLLRLRYGEARSTSAAS